MPILFAPQGEKVKIVAISADDDVKKRLTDMGLGIGSESGYQPRHCHENTRCGRVKRGAEERPEIFFGKLYEKR